jgi:ankyrin repeat protein
MSEETNFNFDYTDALCDACKEGNMAKVEFLFGKGKYELKNIEKKELYKNGDEYNPLNFALKFACEENYEITLFLLQNKADDYKIALKHACKGGHMEIIELIIDFIENYDDDDKYDDAIYNEGLYGACQGGQIEAIELMIEKGADNWNYGLRGACKGGRMEIIELMIEKGAKYTKFALYQACKKGHIKIVKLILKENINYPFEQALNYACKGHIEIVELLINNAIEDGINISEWDWDFKLDIACEKGSIEIIKKIIECGATNFDWGLMSACKRGSMEIIELMIEKGANEWNCALESACDGGYMEIIQFIIGKGAIYDSSISVRYRFPKECKSAHLRC